jgi:YidC/Oxa1 family membrane protein insertase
VDFLYIAVSWVLLRWHDLFALLGLSQSSGVGWALSIIFLVITARLLLFRLFVKQVHYTRNMQKMQPKIQKLRDKYKNDRAELNRQMMALQQEEGFNPLSGCLPMLLQIPVFLGLFHTLRHLSNSVTPVNLCQTRPGSSLLTAYTFTKTQTCDAAQAKIFSTPLAASFHDSGSVIRTLGGDPTASRILLVILLLISAAATLGTQLLARSNMTTVPEGTQATIQKAMLIIIPIGVLASGLLFNFPLGVLLYWFTSNLWTLGQQAYIIRYHPPTEEPVAVVGELGRTLAPKPGQRPVRGRPGNSPPANLTKTPPNAADSADGAAPSRTSSAAPSAGSAATRAGTGTGGPRPGQRPDRSNGKRPPAKRPTQAKKRR